MSCPKFFFCFCSVFWLFLLAPFAQAAEPDSPTGPDSQLAPVWHIDLLTMGPADHLFTRGGHAALLVTHTDANGDISNQVFNYGATDWDQSFMAAKFLLGRLNFRLEISGTLLNTLAVYGTLGDRTIYRQTLNLTAAEA